MPSLDLLDRLGHRLLKKAADHSFNAITVTRAASEDRPGEIIYVNDAFTDLTGYEPEDVLGDTPGILQGPETEQDVLDRLGRRLAAGEIFHGRTINYRKDGSEFMMEWKVLPVSFEEEQAGEEGATHHVAVQREAPGRQEEG